MHPRVSVIVPIYNVEPYVRQCLESLKMQTMPDFEAICIDDCSTDASLAIAQECAASDSRFSVLTQAANQGQSAARNRGLEQASGDYILFLDSDDYYVPDALERLLAKADECDLDVLDFTAHTFYESRQLERQRHEDYESRPSIEGVHTGAWMFATYIEQWQFYCSVCLRLVRRQLIEDHKLRFVEGIIHEDELFSPLLLAYAQRMAFLNEPLYLRRMRADSSITTKRGLRNVVSLFVVTQNLYAWTLENASECSPELLDTMCGRVAHLRMLMALDAQATPREQLDEFAQSLGPIDQVDFNVHARLAPKVVDDLQNIVRQSYSYRVGDKLLTVPYVVKQRALGLARR